MNLFRKNKMIDDEEMIDGKVIVNIDVRRLDRKLRKIKIVVVATWTCDTVFKAEYEAEVKNDYQAVTEAQAIAELFCKHSDYVITSVDTTGPDLVLPTIKMSSVRAR